MFKIIARCSKCDFWNLWKIWDRNRYSKKIWSKNCSSKKNRKRLVEKNFGTKKFRFLVERLFVEKVNDNSKFWDFEKISKKIEISKFWIFIGFFIGLFRQKIEIVWSKMFSTKRFRVFFRRFVFRQKYFRVPISIPNFPKIPKITLRTACDHLKNTNSAHEKNRLFFHAIFRLAVVRFMNLLYTICRRF